MRVFSVSKRLCLYVVIMCIVIISFAPFHQESFTHIICTLSASNSFYIPGWDTKGDQVVLVVRNIRWAIDDYHDILSDIDYAKTWAEATEKIPMLYKGTLYDVLYHAWRDERTMDEIGWYGW